ncbi:MAG: SpaA isopeptide-forming pilin-related protein, partial [Tissierellia bacterium]|nr:SpaA isopeptide-forming pilin-related protein [Tissierellia bacterium]
KLEDGKLVVTDKYSENQVKISKVDLAGKEIAGAKIEIRQGEKVVASWVSEEGKTKTVSLLPGEYSFHELASPKGYEKVTAFNFKVKLDGSLEVKENDEVKLEDGKLVVTDKYSENQVIIKEEESPKTGDSFNWTLYLGAILMATVAFVFITTKSKKHL